MHGVHHSIVEREANSNFSSLLTCWDVLHRTLRLDVPQDEVTIGVPAYRDPCDVAVGRMIALPFRHQPPPWRCPGGSRPERSRIGGPPGRLAP
jgi:hypothetical protein